MGATTIRHDRTNIKFALFFPYIKKAKISKKQKAYYFYKAKNKFRVTDITSGKKMRLCVFASWWNDLFQLNLIFKKNIRAASTHIPTKIGGKEDEFPHRLTY